MHLRLPILLIAGLLALPADAEPEAAPLFDFVAQTTDGKPFALSSLRSKPLLVNFWARWCGPCRQEIPDLAAIDARYRNKGIVVLGVAVEDAQYGEAVRDFAKAYAVSYRIALSGTEKGVDLMRALGNDRSGLPFTVLIDRSGTLVAKKLGAMSQAEMRAAIEKALK